MQILEHSSHSPDKGLLSLIPSPLFIYWTWLVSTVILFNTTSYQTSYCRSGARLVLSYSSISTAHQYTTESVEALKGA